MDFALFQRAVAAQWARMAAHPLYRVKTTDRNDLVDKYLDAYPPGTNEIFRKRREHDCACCRSFVRSVGDVVALIDGKVTSVWDVTVDEPAYQTVAKKMAKIVKAREIDRPFLSPERTAGSGRTFDEYLSGKQWDHFNVNIPAGFVMDRTAIPAKLGDLQATHDVFKRGLETITDDAIQTVLDLIGNGSLYRGDEFKFLVEGFGKLRAKHKALLDFDHPADLAAFYWQAPTREVPVNMLRIRNTSIGTLLVALSEGQDLDAAVREYESKVAPQNYRRTTALVTPKMIEQAKGTVQELGLLSALERRYATARDISVDNVLFAHRATRNAATGDAFDDLAAASTARAKVSDKIEEVPIAKFVSDILPRVTSIEALVEPSLKGNFVSLLAPVDPTAGRLFKWPNNFSWSYNGDVADSMKERVKAAGGNVTGDLCMRLAWNNSDDLDFHLRWDNGHVYYGHKREGGATLDVDANGMDGIRENPVENIYFASKSRIEKGTVYELSVHQWSRRNQEDPHGFDAEIDFMGQVTSFSFPRRLKPSETVMVAKFRLTKAGEFEIIESMDGASGSRKARAAGAPIWGVPTHVFHPVSLVCRSPNFWGEQGIGNEHYFFMLDGCKNEGTARGFYNEFLDNRLDPHRKVFEMLGARMRPEDTDNQLSGLGFSSTQRNSLTLRVKGSYTRTLKVLF